MRDLMNNINLRRLFSPVASAADNTAWVSQIIDLQGFDSVCFAILTGALPDADATFTVTIAESDASNMSGSNAVASTDLVGTTALASFIFSDDDKVFKLGYIGSKRYVQVTVTPANNASASLYAGVAILGNPSAFPTSNPPS